MSTMAETLALDKERRLFVSASDGADFALFLLAAGCTRRLFTASVVEENLPSAVFFLDLPALFMALERLRNGWY